MKSHKLLNPQTLKPQKLGPIFLPIQSLCFLTQPDPPPPITHHSLLNSIQTCQWHFIEHLPPNLPSSLISQTFFHLHQSPHLVHQFTSHIDFPRLEIQTQCLAVAILAALPSPKPSLELLKQLLGSGIAPVRDVFDSLALARVRLTAQSGVVLDLLVSACCELKRANEAFECFKLMTSGNVMPRTKTCNELLSLFSKLNRTERAWVLYADMFRLKIKSSVCTFNIMINVLCKEGKLNKAKEFLGFMEILGIKPTVVTYNTIIHGFCLRGRVGGA
ncbi:pentatricopeptide repeat-containing protein At2g15630, mitochondrial-like [Rosa chinensis]|uniref:pentatricopeptide repeat-containing protein At2g15630, mitochondrial-like n=1 Tax=Rosa chinensis TaxID=74649 RepID=UPI001AD8EB62|nr:pentatricopeptide repeat-containing protein At2g15630, mitochondrial-like [Rosa chinensis]